MKCHVRKRGEHTWVIVPELGYDADGERWQKWLGSSTIVITLDTHSQWPPDTQEVSAMEMDPALQRAIEKNSGR